MKTYKTFADCKKDDVIYNLTQDHLNKWKIDKFKAIKVTDKKVEFTDSHGMNFLCNRTEETWGKVDFMGGNYLFVDLDFMKDVISFRFEGHELTVINQLIEKL